MNNSEMMMFSLASLRDQLRAAAGTIDVVLELMTRPVDEPKSENEKKCTHPMAARAPMATMGHATRFYCRRCACTVEGNNGEGKESDRRQEALP